MSDIGWTILPPFDFIVGETYIVDATHDDGIWGKFLIKILSENDIKFEFEILTVLDGSPGLVDGFIKGARKDDT